jgi:hypothetical protein
MVEAANKDLGDKLARAKDGEIIPVKGISGQHVMFEFPGATKEQYQFVEYLRSRLDRSSGMTATVQGDVAASNTATEAQIASDAMSNRVKFIKNKAADGMRDSLSRIAWYLFHTEGIVIPVNRRDTTTGQMIEGVFFGGPMPTDQGATYDDFAIEVQVGDDNTETTKVKVMGFYQVFFQVMQAAPLMPWVRWTEVVRDLADAWDMSTHSDDWFIPEFLGGYTQPQLFPVSQLTGGGQDLTAQDQATPLVNYNPTLNPNNPGAQLSGNPGMLPPGRPQSQGSSQAAPGTNMKPVVAGRMASNGQTSGPRPQMQR